MMEVRRKFCWARVLAIPGINVDISEYFREYPLQPATLKARQELLQLVVDNSDDLPYLDPMRDLKINDMEYVELREKRVILESMVTSYDCVHCPLFERHVSIAA